MIKSNSWSPPIKAIETTKPAVKCEEVSKNSDYLLDISNPLSPLSPFNPCSPLNPINWD